MIADRGPRAKKRASIYIEPELDIDRSRFHFAATGVTGVIPLIYKGKIGLQSVYGLSGAVTGARGQRRILR